MCKLTGSIIGGMMICIFCSAVFGDAESDYKELFGAKDARVKASRSKLDDVAFAQELMESAAAIAESPELQTLLYEKLLPFAAAGLKGHAIGVQALDILEKKLPARMSEWRVHRLVFLRSQYSRAPSKTRKDAALAYLEGLIAAADAQVSSGKASEAMVNYRLAASLAGRYRRDIVADIRRRSVEAGKVAAVDSKMAKLQAKLKADPDSVASRQELMQLYLIQKDSPADAAGILNDSVSQDLRTHVPLAFRTLDSLSDAECLKLGQWYHKTLGAKATGSGKNIVLKRAAGYYQKYVELHETQDVSRAQARLTLKRIQDELARMAPKPRKTLTITKAPKDALVFGGHRYKVYPARGVPIAEAVKACKKLGGTLVTIESQAEMAFLLKLVGSGRLWVGATDQAAEGKWIWINGKPLSGKLKLWASGEPNQGRAANYASLTSAGMRDNANPYSSITGFICEWDR